MSENTPRPEPIDVRPENVPRQLRERDQWVAWGYRWQDDRDEWTKVPLNAPGGYRASSTNPDTWTDFQTALEYHRRSDTDTDGVGFVVSDDDLVVGLDYDDCRIAKTGDSAAWVKSAFDDVPTYAEVSPSGTGFRQFGFGFVPDGGNRADVDGTDGHIELYDSGRYLTVTGHQVEQTPDDVAQVKDEIEQLHSKHIVDDSSTDGATGSEPASTPPRDVSDDELLERARDAKNGDKFQKLYDRGDTSGYPSQSEADFALCTMLAFWTGGDRNRIDTLFRDSALMRSKWDEDRGSQTYGERTIENAISDQTEFFEPDGGRDRGGSVSNSEPDVPDVSGIESAGATWDDVSDLYAGDRVGAARMLAADVLENEYSWMYVLESQVLWVYDADAGYYQPWGEEKLRWALEQELGEHFSKSQANEIIARIEARNQTHRRELNARPHDDPLVCSANGVVNIRTGELREHSPDYNFIRGVPHEWNPDATPERALRFLRSVTKRDADMRTLLQQLGHGLMPGHPFKAFVVMYGPGDNGKTAVGKLFREFVGDDNAASVELRDFRDDDFATGDLPGAMINVGDDLSGKVLKDVSVLKRLTGGDTLRANEKFEKTFDFQNEAAMFFSGNEPPKFQEQTDALKGRLYPIHMPFRFTQENDEHPDADPHLVEKIASDSEEMSGLFHLAVTAAQELIESGGNFAMPESPDERMKMYEAASDPIRRFVMDYLKQGDSDDLVLKDDVYDVYTAMCESTGERSTSGTIFKQQVSSQAIVDVETGQTRKWADGDEREWCWRYLTFDDDAREHMSPRLERRYFGGVTGATGQTAATADGGTTAAADNAADGELASLDVGRHDLTVTVAEVLEAPPWLESKGHVVDDDGNIMEFVVPGGADTPTLSESERLRLRRVKVGTDRDGMKRLEITGIVDVEHVKSGQAPLPDDDGDDDGDSGTDGDADTDDTDDTDDSPRENDESGGEEPKDDAGPPADAEGTRADIERIEHALRDAGAVEGRDTALTVPAIAGRLSSDMSPDRIERLLEKGRFERGTIMQEGDSYRLRDD
jgi:P4 family phage/plasmid primase-like protien